MFSMWPSCRASDCLPKIRDVLLEWLNMCPEPGAPFFDLMWGTSQSPIGMAGTGSPWRLFPVSRIELCVSRRFATQLMTYSPEFHCISYKYTNTLAVNTPWTINFVYHEGNRATWLHYFAFFFFLSPYISMPRHWCPLSAGQDEVEIRLK